MSTITICRCPDAIFFDYADVITSKIPQINDYHKNIYKIKFFLFFFMFSRQKFQRNVADAEHCGSKK